MNKEQIDKLRNFNDNTTEVWEKLLESAEQFIEDTFNSPEDFKQNFDTSDIKISELTKNAIDVAYERLLENGWEQE
jgi:hypothetical protein